MVEYSGDLDVKGLKSFCQDNLPKFSKGVNLREFKVDAEAVTLPKVMLLSTKKSTPVIWRALSGLYHKRFAFYNAEVVLRVPFLHYEEYFLCDLDLITSFVS